MVELRRWRLRLKDNGDYMLNGVDKHGIVISKSITKQSIQRIDLDTSFIQIHLSNRIYCLWLKDVDLSKPIVYEEVAKTILFRCSVLFSCRGKLLFEWN